MIEPEIEAIRQRLDETVVLLRQANDPEHKRALLKKMRSLMAELDNLEFDQTRFPTK